MARYMKAAFGEKVLLGTKMWFTVRYCSFINGFRNITLQRR